MKGGVKYGIKGRIKSGIRSQSKGRIERNSKYAKDFYSGNFKPILEALGVSPITHGQIDLAPSDIAFHFGALVFTGKVLESEVYYKFLLRRFSQKANLLIFCRFILAVGFIRISKYNQAVSLLTENYKNVRSSLKQTPSKSREHQLFYVRQGAAFFKFFRGQFVKSRLLAEAAYKHASAAQHRFGEVLSLDLMGHSLCHTGSIRRGLFELKRALEIARAIGNGGIASAISVSIVKFEAQYGILAGDVVSRLSGAVGSLKLSDTYSKAEIYLEMIRQLLLRGKGFAAQELINEVSHHVYENQNKRQIAVYNFRYSYLLFLKGEGHAALALLQTLINSLDQEVDAFLLRQVLGFMERVQAKLGLSDTARLKKEQIKIIHSQTNNYIDSRITTRNGMAESRIAWSQGEDPMGDIIDKTSPGNFSNWNLLVENGLYGLLPVILDSQGMGSFVFLGPSRSEVTIQSGAEVYHVSSGLTKSIKGLLMSLNGEVFRSKEYLIRKVWNYSYDPAIHDKLLYATISKLRALLGPFGSWLEWSDEGYRFRQRVINIELNRDFNSRQREFLETKISAVESGPTSREFSSSTKEITNSLNFRQVKILGILESLEVVTVKNYSKQFKVTTMTAYRDLSDLHKKGRVVRLGVGRATVYGLRKRGT